MALLGASDPRLDAHGNIHYSLQQQLRGYARLDTPADRVKPIPFAIIQHLVTNAATPLQQAVSDIATIGFYFLLRPGEHTVSTTTSDSTPFCLQDVTFKLGNTILPGTSGPLHLIQLATFATLRFTKQKNGTENELIGHARSGHSTTCPVLALIRRTIHLRAHNAPPTTPLCSVYIQDNTTTTVTSEKLTAALRHSATLLYPQLGFPAADISARALRAGGAMALLCAKVDSDIIKLIGRWKSDQMLRYLHLQAYPQMQSFSRLMATHGDFRLLHAPTPPPPHNQP